MNSRGTDKGKDGSRRLRNKADVSDCNCGTVAEVSRIAFSVSCVSFEGDMRCECIVNASNIFMGHIVAFDEI